MIGLAEKKGGQEADMNDANMKVREQSANVYRATMEKLAAPKPSVNIDTAKLLKKAVELLPEDILKADYIAGKITAKLEAIINPKETIEAMLESL